MNRFILSLLMVGMVAGPTTALAAERNPHTFRTVAWFDWLWNVSARVKDRTLEPIVRNNHTDHNRTTGQAVTLFRESYEANMCVLERKHCMNSGNADGCIQFTNQNGIRCNYLEPR